MQQLLAHVNTSGLLPRSLDAERCFGLLLANDMCDLFELVLLDLAGPWTSTLFFSVDWRFLAASTIIMIIILKVWNGPQVRLCFTYASWILSFFSGFSFLSRALFGTSARGQSLYLHLHCHRSSVRHDVV